MPPISLHDMTTGCAAARGRRDDDGFSLLEVLVSMAILTVIVLMTSSLFRDASVAWTYATQKAESNTGARAVLEYIGRELSMAVAGPIDAADTVAHAPALPFTLTGGTQLRFLSMVQEPSDQTRALRGIAFEWNPGDGTLRYDRETQRLTTPGAAPYKNAWNWGGGALGNDSIVLTNVVDFAMYACPDLAAMSGSTYLAGLKDYDSSSYAGQLPVCIDIVMTIMPTDEMLRYARVPIADKPDYMTKHSKVYSTRVYFVNREGYSSR